MQVNHLLVQKLGIKEAIMLGELCSLYSYFEDKDKLKTIQNISDMFYATIDFLTTDTGLSQRQISAAIKVLEDTFVNVEIKEDDVKKIVNMPLIVTKITTSYGDRIKWFKVNFEAIDQFIKNASKTGTVSENTIRRDAFILYNKLLALKTNPTCAVVFSDLLTSYYITEYYENLVDDEWFKNVQTDQAKRLGVDRRTMARKDGGYITQLEEYGLIEISANDFNDLQ